MTYIIIYIYISKHIHLRLASYNHLILRWVTLDHIKGMASAKRAKVGVVASLELRNLPAPGAHESTFQQPCCFHVWVGSRICVCAYKRWLFLRVANVTCMQFYYIRIFATHERKIWRDRERTSRCCQFHLHSVPFEVVILTDIHQYSMEYSVKLSYFAHLWHVVELVRHQNSEFQVKKVSKMLGHNPKSRSTTDIW